MQHTNIKTKKISPLIIASMMFAATITSAILIGSSPLIDARSFTPLVGAQSPQKTVVRDSQTILLEGKTIPAKGFIHVYDATPYMIMSGHIAANLPCDTNTKTPYNVLIGQAPNVKPAQLDYIKELSTPGKMCIYHVDVNSEPGGKAGIITDIALQNPTTTDVKFPPMSTLVIGVDEIAPGAEMGGNMTKG
jgi:hypothetical protein